jgi:hypothetical protein
MSDYRPRTLARHDFPLLVASTVRNEAQKIRG